MVVTFGQYPQLGVSIKGDLSDLAAWWDVGVTAGSGPTNRFEFAAISHREI